MDCDFLRNLLEKLIAAEREAGELILGARDIPAETKSSHRDVVTEYDKKVQALMISRLRAAVPSAAFFCEENAVQEELGGEHVFIIDPIDGTMNFVRHFHRSCISAAYMSRGEILLAAVYDPYADEMFTAIKGQGAFLNGRPISAGSAPLRESVFCFGSSPYYPQFTKRSFQLAELAFEHSLDLRRMASAELDLCSVAAGRAGMYFELCISFWDYAAGSLIVTEAGGSCCRINGSPLPMDGSSSSIIAGSREAAADFLRLIAENNI
ncbi:MAG: inositol monophosphatase family protein [Candidatus Limivicinus sp.]|jgi:fructose-1,6-bisphosphatase/inositol monophosphatase family enzyme